MVPASAVGRCGEPKDDAKFTLGVQQQLVALERLLERGAHERVARARELEHLEVHPEERQVDAERQDDEARDAREEVLGELLLREEGAARTIRSAKVSDGGGAGSRNCWRDTRTIVSGARRWTFIRSQRSHATAVPTVRNVRRPTILQPSVHASQKPVADSQNHHDLLNAR